MIKKKINAFNEYINIHDHFNWLDIGKKNTLNYKHGGKNTSTIKIDIVQNLKLMFELQRFSVKLCTRVRLQK